MDEAIRKSKLCNTWLKQRYELNKSWKTKKKENMEQRSKGFNPSPFRKGTKVALIIIIIGQMWLLTMDKKVQEPLVVDSMITQN